MMSRRRTPAVGQVAGLVVKRGGVWARNDPIRRTRSQRHGKAINHNTGRVSQRTQCRPRQPDWSSDLFRPARLAASWSVDRRRPAPRGQREDSGRRLNEPQCRPFSADASGHCLIGDRERNSVAHNWILRPRGALNHQRHLANRPVLHRQQHRNATFITQRWQCDNVQDIFPAKLISQI